jgi:hypothetical protein
MTADNYLKVHHFDSITGEIVSYVFPFNSTSPVEISNACKGVESEVSRVHPRYRGTVKVTMFNSNGSKSLRFSQKIKVEKI